MLICNCTLVGTNACSYCSNTKMINDFKEFWRSMPITYTFTTYKTYNSETHELVEKKEVKINDISREIDNLTSCIYIIRSNNDIYQKGIEEYTKKIEDGNKRIEEYKDKISKLKQEKEQLEKENPK